MKRWSSIKEKESVQLGTSFIAAFIGGWLFTLIHAPIPWLLGPMTAMLLVSRTKIMTFIWPKALRDTGLVIVGYSIGLSFTYEAFADISRHLPSMLLLTCFIILMCSCIAFLVSKISGIDYPTALTSSIPGGLSQIVVFAEEVKVINLTIVTFFHVTRVILVVFLFPFLVFNSAFTEEEAEVVNALSSMNALQWEDLFPNIFFFAVICVMAAKLAKKWGVPAPFFLGPVFAVMVLTLCGLEGPALPLDLLDVSKFLVGGYIGLLLKSEKIVNKKKMIPLAFLSSFLLICTTLACSVFLANQHNLSYITSFLSLAPGGMDQMGIIAHEVDADLSTVASYQLFRMLFIYIAIPPMLRLVLKWNVKKMSNKQIHVDAD